MKKKCRAGTSLALALALLLSLIGCQPQDPASSQKTEPDTSAPSMDQSGSKQTEEAEPIDFAWQPKVYSDYQKQGDGKGWGPEMEQLYYDTVDAIMGGAKTVSCPGVEYYGNLLPLLQSNFPVVSKVLADFVYRDGMVDIFYSCSDAERKQSIRAFSRRIEELIEGAVCKDDTPTMAALALYHRFVSGLHYDYAAMEDDTATMDVTPYRALMTGDGICQSFGPAYAYLCMQLGINAVEVNGLDEGDTTAHSWTMLELNGHHSRMDPTFEATDSETGLLRFGMNAEQRMSEGSYPVSKMGLGFNLADSDGFELTDDSFSPLWGLQQVYQILRTPEGMAVRGVSDLCEVAEKDVIPVEDGKTLTVEHMSPWEVQMELMGPEYAALTHSVWSVSGYEIAILEHGEGWVQGENYDGPVHCWVTPQAVLMMDIVERESGGWQLQPEPDGTLTIRGEDSTVTAVRLPKGDSSKYANKFVAYVDMM